MNTNLSKQLQVMSAVSHQDTQNVKKRKLEDAHQSLISSDENYTTSNDHGFATFCTNRSLKIFDDKCLQTFNVCVKSGKYLNMLFSCEFCN